MANPFEGVQSPKDYVQQFSSPPFPQMERIVRPFRLIDSAPPAAAPTRQPLPGEEGEAFLAWGDTSRFIRPDLSEPVTSATPFGAPGARYKWEKEEPEDEDDETDDDVSTYREISREVQKIRVQNPNDAEQYVMVERITSIKFSRPSGGSVRFVFNNR
ncbi:MAG: hypothetical protein K2Y29_00390 [Beijerinckiaceae bacterium]|nr:hypothetical protein [Beijerinckiaceae bacterium]